MKPSMLRWASVVVLSALVGSAATLAVTRLSPSAAAPSAGSTTAGTSVSQNVIPTVANVDVSSDIEQVVKKVEPAVVGVVDYTQNQNPFFATSDQSQESGVGTGVLFYKDSQSGYVVTNNHVVEGADKVEIVLNSGKHVPATVVGTDPYTDLAVLKVAVSNVQDITPVTFGNSDNLQAGEPAIAIGTPMGLDFADTVTSGIISAPKRVMPVQDEQTQETLNYQTVIQTDAAINPGNSGGPLLNIAGQVIGINSSKIVAQGVEGMGFAIPSNQVVKIAYQILKTGHANHPALGIEGYSLASLPDAYQPNVPVNYGVWVRAVTSTQAQQAGLKAQDVIVAIDGKTVQNIADLRTNLFEHQPGDQVTLTVYRGSERLSLKVTLTDMQSASSASGQTRPSSPYGN
ncbi:S1C family serine protease [Alicyclobacillus macrosporangiidus]|uniref:Serine protease Do n=1 Tax=Alicyclobacillus macrosporangiidus TaxID=392015 RepID=A0A1I7J3X7_9BACL|nr:trypsin-like peptidase domain-containing protein [Alicyclobacillus macrosporangiidus]SFU79841.1 serine protease Do [Alicyclobacillus macrosporangiidus]